MKSEKQLDLTHDAAETLAIEALTFLTAQPDDIGRFLALAGIGPATLRSAAADPRFLAGVLDYFLGNEDLLRAYAQHAGIPPEHVGRARRALGT